MKICAAIYHSTNMKSSEIRNILKGAASRPCLHSFWVVTTSSLILVGGLLRAQSPAGPTPTSPPANQSGTHTPASPVGINPASPGTVTPPANGAIMNQPVVVNSFENVEMERLRIADELAKTQKEEVAFREQVARLQARLATASLSVASPDGIPTDFRTFLSSSQTDIETSKKYYDLLKSTLNDLTPESPYQARTAMEKADPKRAADNLLHLAEFSEDEGICRTIRGHLSELYGGRRDDGNRRANIDAALATLAKEKRDLEHNLKMTYERSGLTGRPSGSDADRRLIADKMAAVRVKEEALLAEKNSLSHVVKEIPRKLQFQQFILELAFQQRYIHALMACGFYRGSPSRGDLAIPKEAYPVGRSASGPSTPPLGQPSAGGGLTPALPASIPALEIPYIATISGLEAFLTNRIRDAMKDREALDNMIKDKQISAAEGILRKLVLTGKYQPELHTVPGSFRQLILQYGQQMRMLSEALNAKDYAEIKTLCDQVGASSGDANMRDVLAFATEQPKKAMHAVHQAELALKFGDRKSAAAMIDSAVNRAPLDKEVEKAIQDLQGTLLSNTKLSDELQKLVDRDDYRAAYERMNEFMPLVAAGNNQELKTKFDTLIDREKSVRTVLEKCDLFEKRGAYPDLWLSLTDVAPEVAEDQRLTARKSSVAGKCPKFVTAYAKAGDNAKAGNDPLTLAWYLTALAEAPGNSVLVDKINAISKNLANK